MAGCSVPISNTPAEDKPPIAELFPVLEANESLSQATFAGGCFWCTESAFQEAEGVEEVVSGFAGGVEENPTYDEVVSKKTTHREAIRVYYNPEQINYSNLLEIFWNSIDPTDDGGQFADRGSSYTTAIFYHDATQQKLAQESKEALDESGTLDGPVVTPVVPLTTFYPAGDFHQDFYQHSHVRYNLYKEGSGRNRYFQEREKKEESADTQKEKDFQAGKIDSSYDLTPEEIEERRKNLDPLSYHVVVEEGTERPFDNEYWNHKAAGIYVDKVTGEPLFSSTHKYDSGTGWPTFYKSLTEDAVTMHEDNSLSMTRTEIRSAEGDSHLGHVFSDGPKEHGGQRFCTNSASLRFIPRAEMESAGYGEWLYLFDDQ